MEQLAIVEHAVAYCIYQRYPQYMQYRRGSTCTHLMLARRRSLQTKMVAGVGAVVVQVTQFSSLVHFGEGFWLNYTDTRLIDHNNEELKPMSANRCNHPRNPDDVIILF